MKNLFTYFALLTFAMMANEASAWQGDAEAKGGAVIQGHDHIEPSPAFYAAWEAEVKRNTEALSAKQRLISKAAGSVKLSWPLRSAIGRPEFSLYTVTNYIDHQPVAGSILDYQCGTRSYDNANGGHLGTDISSWGIPKAVLQKQEGLVVIAAAAGTITQRSDGQADNNCIGTSSADRAGISVSANSLTVTHDDGTKALYFHFKRDSLTPKTVGTRVEEGEYLGIVGSSGYSSGPHLHFEVRGTNNEVLDPWAGTCNTTTSGMWKQQENYAATQTSNIMTLGALPANINLAVQGSCVNSTLVDAPDSDYLTGKWYFKANDTLTVMVFLRDHIKGSTANMRVLDPNGLVVTTGTLAASTDYYGNSYWYWTRTLPNNAVSGRYAVEFVYANTTKLAYFYVGVGQAIENRVYDFYSPSLNHYFRTGYAQEAGVVAAGLAGDWRTTADDVNMLAVGNDLPGTSGVCRFYGHPTIGPNSHYYTADKSECAALKQLQSQTPFGQPRWNFEEIAFTAYVPSGGICPHAAPIPIYQLYNKRAAQNDSNHRTTSKTSEVVNMVAKGWLLENNGQPVMCAASRPY